MPTDAPDFTCIVCAEVVSVTMSAECNWCNNRYHLNPRNDIVARDCGQVWIDEQYMALQFACQNCLADGNAPAPAAKPAPVRRAGASRPRRYRRRL